MNNLAPRRKLIAYFSQSFIGVVFLMMLWSLWVPRIGYAQEEWSLPINLSNDLETSRYAAIVADNSGTIHVVWLSTEPAGSEENKSAFLYMHKSGMNWSVPVDIFFSDGNAGLSPPRMVIDQENNLHIVWKENAQIWYSQAPAVGAGSAANWKTPVIIGFRANNMVDPDIAVDHSGNLSIIFAIGSGQGGNIYHTISRDGGENWSRPEPVLNGLEDFEAINDIQLAVDAEGGLHIVWTESDLLTGFPPVGVRYAHLLEEGGIWSQPVEVDGPFGLSGLITVGEDIVHWVWSGTADQRQKFHSWSVDRGESWSPVNETLPVGGFHGWPALALDSEDRVHLIQAWGPGQAFLNHQIWDGAEWVLSETILEGEANLPIRIVGSGASPNNPAIAIALGNELHVVMGQFDEFRPDRWTDDIFYMQKRIDVAGYEPEQIEEWVTPEPVPLITPHADVIEESTTAEQVVTRPTQVSQEVSPVSPLPAIFLTTLPGSLLISLFVLIKLRQKR
jgi:hypothetical protein